MPRATASAAHTRTVAPLHERPPYLGFGLGLRAQHYSEILDGDPAVDWFEAISENSMVPGGQPLPLYVICSILMSGAAGESAEARPAPQIMNGTIHIDLRIVFLRNGT